MEASKRVAVMSWFFLLGVGLAAAQDKKIGVEAKCKFQHTAEIISMYDKRKDQTTIVMDWYNVYRGLPDDKHPNSVEAVDNRVDIHAGFIFAGRSLSSPPEAVEFGIKVGNVGGPKFKNGDAPELTAVVDGETISLGNVTVVKTRTSVVTTESTRQVSFAQLSASFTYRGLQRIGQARKVIMKVGPLQFELKDANLEALRDLASRGIPYPPV